MNVQDGSLYPLFFIQMCLVVGVAGIFLLNGLPAAISAFYGGGVALASSTLLGRSLRAAGATAQHAPKQGVWMLYFGAVQRFLLVLALLGIGMGMFKLSPLPLIAGFAGAQMAFLIGGLGRAASFSTTDKGKRT
ncbi:MAG TPA: ATP synthase subunit I [Nitrococcus sp.]|nr:ATP synthase subunit I [Nitrococcus sp.]